MTQITDDIHFCVAGAVFGLECDFLWQAQHLVQFWEIAGAQNAVFFSTKSSPRSQGEGLRSGGGEMTVLSPEYRRIIIGLSSDHARIVFLLADQGVSAQILSFKIQWQAQYLVSFQGDFTCSAHWK